MKCAEELAQDRRLRDVRRMIRWCHFKEDLRRALKAIVCGAIWWPVVVVTAPLGLFYGFRRHFSDAKAVWDCRIMHNWPR